MKAQNAEVLRHEGAHQLAYDLGLVNNINFDIWLNEGLAEYCSPPYLGEKKRTSLDIIKKAVAQL